MDKKIKNIMIILIGIFALITIVGYIYGSQNKKATTDLYASYDETILNAVDSSIKVCENAFTSVSATDEELINLNDYKTNIEEADTAVLKGYIADAMLTYTGDFVMVKSQNYIAGIEGSIKANYDSIQEKLVAAKTKLTSARSYYTNNNTDATQAQ